MTYTPKCFNETLIYQSEIKLISGTRQNSPKSLVLCPISYVLSPILCPVSFFCHNLDIRNLYFIFVNERSFIMKTNQKEHIADVALQLFADNGYGNTSIAMIAKKAGVAQGLMYNFYSSKEDLLIEILNRGFDVIQSSMAGYAKEKDPRKAITKHIEATFSLVEENKEYWKLFHSIRMQNTIKNFIDKTYEPNLGMILSTLASNFKKLKYKNPALEAKLFFATIDGLVNHFLVDEKEFSLKKIKKHLIQKYTI